MGVVVGGVCVCVSVCFAGKIYIIYNARKEATKGERRFV